MNYDYMLFMSIFTATGILSGLCFIGKVVRKYNRPSFVAFALGILVVISTFVSIYSSIVSLKLQMENDVNVYAGDSVC